MLEMHQQAHLPFRQYGVPAVEIYDWRWMIRAGLRRAWLIIMGGLVCAAIAVAYVALRPSHYTASAVLNITNLRLTTSGEDAFFTESQFDPTFLETQIETIGSTPVLANVVQALKLDENSDQQRALKALRGGLAIQRLGQSNLVEIRSTAGVPERAAVIANDVARAYMAKQEADRNEAVQSASGWLRDRLREAGPKAVVMSAATPPVDKSNPRGLLIIVAAGVVGGAVGFVAALVFAFLDRSFRRPGQLAGAAGVECFGAIPTLSADNVPSGLPFHWAIATRVGKPEWQALRLAWVSMLPADLKTTRVVGVTSAVAGEGKTVLAANLALHVSQFGGRVLLVDANPYRPELTALAGHTDRPGLIDCLDERQVELSALIIRETQPGLDVLPLGQARNAAPMLWSARMHQFLEAVDDYDLVIFDLPPLEAKADVRASERFIDMFLLVVEAGRLSDEALARALSAIPSVRDKLIGSLLNRCDREPAIGWLPPFVANLVPAR